VGFVAELGGELSTLETSKLRVRSERDDLIAALYEEGVPVADIAERAAVCVKTVRNVARRLALPGWLGVLDGDGSVGIYRDGRSPRLSFAGTEALMEQCERFWRKHLGIDGARPSARPHAGGLWTFNLSCAKAEAAARTLLGASPVSMRRKRALLAQIAGRTA
jgi:hypothetical protein